MLDSKQIYDYIIKIQSIAKIGLIYSKDPYAISNYQEINDLSLKFLEEFLEVKFDRPNFFSRDIYPTPNISVRCLIFNEDKTEVLMVREVATQTYSLPGGWADLYNTASETAKIESRQEAGADVEIIKLVALLDRTPFKKAGSIPEYMAVFEGKLKGPLHEHEYETDDVGFFKINQLPEVSRKTSHEEIRRLIEAAKNDKTIFD